MQKISPCLWFDTQAEEAMNFYVSTFKKAFGDALPSKVGMIRRYPDEVPMEFMKGREGKVITGIFELAGQSFMALDGGPLFKFNPSISLMVRCQTEACLDTLWNHFIDGGEVMMPLDTYSFSKKYGWLNDKYGLSWQMILVEEGEELGVTPSFLFVKDQVGKAEEAMRFYVDTFSDSGINGEIHRYGDALPPNDPKHVMHAEFKLQGQTFTIADSAEKHDFNFSEAVSLYVECDTTAELDHLWETLSAVPESEQCGWLKDRYGVSWQIAPKQLEEMMSDPDPAKVERVTNAVLSMKKLDLEQLRAAYNGA